MCLCLMLFVDSSSSLFSSFRCLHWSDTAINLMLPNITPAKNGSPEIKLKITKIYNSEKCSCGQSDCQFRTRAVGYPHRRLPIIFLTSGLSQNSFPMPPGSVLLKLIFDLSIKQYNTIAICQFPFSKYCNLPPSCIYTWDDVLWEQSGHCRSLR